jgi:hypothetical protein
LDDVPQGREIEPAEVVLEIWEMTHEPSSASVSRANPSAVRATLPKAGEPVTSDSGSEPLDF